MRIVAVIQARMTSTRLPGKVLAPVLGRPLLAYQIERVRRARTVGAIVLATTENDTDDPVAALAREAEIGLFRGSEDDVLARFHGAAVAAEADVVVRLTADCPLHDPAVIDLVVRRFLDSRPPADYASNALTRTFPHGLDTEVMTMAALDEAYREAIDPVEREHVTPFIYRRRGRYRVLEVLSEDPGLAVHRWTVDEPADLALVSRILEALYRDKPDFTTADVLALVARHPEWSALNAHVQQRTVTR